MSNPFYLHVFPFHIPYPPNVIRYSAMKSHEKSLWIIPKQSGNTFLLMVLLLCIMSPHYPMKNPYRLFPMISDIYSIPSISHQVLYPISPLIIHYSSIWVNYNDLTGNHG
jgi:hypothetical protein